MKIYANACVAYAIKLSTEYSNDEAQAAVVAVQERFPGLDLGYMDAGYFDSRRFTYITASCEVVQAGEWKDVGKVITGSTVPLYDFWDKALRAVAARLEDSAETLFTPRWMLVCDVDN